MEIAVGLHFQIQEAVAGELVQHMVEKADAGRDSRMALAVQVHGGPDLGLPGLARHLGFAHGIRLSNMAGQSTSGQSMAGQLAAGFYQQ